jgi:hypothetical protein
VIWDNRPAQQWDDAYPTGNGRLGVMPFGQYTVDITWKDGSLDRATIHAGKNAASGTIPVVYNGISKTIALRPGQKETVTKEQYESK